jgi:hypothetical protein
VLMVKTLHVAAFFFVLLAASAMVSDVEVHMSDAQWTIRYPVQPLLEHFTTTKRRHRFFAL